MRLALLLTLLAAPLAGQAQSAQAQAQGVINSNGYECPSVTRMRGVGTITGTEDVVIAAACSNGDRHALRTGPDNELEYMMPCYLFNQDSKRPCFPR